MKIRRQLLHPTRQKGARTQGARDIRAKEETRKGNIEKSDESCWHGGK